MSGIDGRAGGVGVDVPHGGLMPVRSHDGGRTGGVGVVRPGDGMHRHETDGQDENP